MYLILTRTDTRTVQVHISTHALSTKLMKPSETKSYSYDTESILKYEPGHSIAYKCVCVPSEDSDQNAEPPLLR